MNKQLNSNKQFMIGNGIMAFAVIFVVVLFVYMSFRLKYKSDEKYDGIYDITLVEGFLNDTTEIHLNDSIIFNDKIESEPFTISINQFSQQGALLFVDKASNDISIFNLSEDGGKYSFKKTGKKVVSLDK